MKILQRLNVGELTLTVLRLGLGVLFIVAASDKIADPDAFARSIGNYKLVQTCPALLLATVLPWVELLLGVGLVLGVWVRGSALLALFLLTAFTAAVGSALWRGLDISCGCFSHSPTAERIGWWKIGENLLLIVISGIILFFPDNGFSPFEFLRKHILTSEGRG